MVSDVYRIMALNSYMLFNIIKNNFMFWMHVIAKSKDKYEQHQVIEMDLTLGTYLLP